MGLQFSKGSEDIVAKASACTGWRHNFLFQFLESILPTCCLLNLYRFKN